MTSQESFKRRVRARMAKTGERYGAARRVLLTPAEQDTTGPAPMSHRRVAEPPHSDEAVVAATGRDWDTWTELIDAGPGRSATHAAIATWLREAHGVGDWWAQGVTVGYERITGVRLLGQMPDGTFTVTRSRIVPLDAATLRSLLLDDVARKDLLPDLETTLRSKAASKVVRFDLARGEDDLGIVGFALDPAGERLRITVTHEKIPTIADTDHWKSHWADWLTAVAESATP